MKVPRFALNRARRLIASPQALLRAVEQATRKAAAVGSRPLLKAVLEELKAMLGLLKAWATGTYPGVSKTNLLLIAGAVVYFLMPTDLLPDFIFGAGYVDDAMVITWVITTAREELDRFKRWRAASDSPDDLSAPNS